MRIMAAEDSPADAQSLNAHIARFASERGLDFDLELYGDGALLLEASPESADLVLLDIEMPRLDGISTARALRQRGCTMPIAFLTNLDSFALEGYSVGALGYLLKPIAYPSFEQMLDRMLVFTTQHAPHLVPFKVGKEERFVDERKVAYVETQRKRTFVHAQTGDFACTEPMKSVEGKLDAHAFFRVHNAFLVNLAFAESVQSDHLIVLGDEIPISKHRKAPFFAALSAYVARSR